MAGQVIQEGDEDDAMSDINVVPLDRRDAGAPDRLPDHHPGRDPDGPGQAAERALRADDDQAGQRFAHRPQRPGDTCEVYWGLTKVTQKDLLDRAVKKLEDQIKEVGGVQNINEDNMPEAHIRGDVNTQYKCIGAAIITMQQAGFPARRLHFRSRRRWPAIAPNRSISPCRCRPPATMPKANR